MGVIYATAKAAVAEYSRCLAMQLRPYNVMVNVVAPGPILTPRFAASRPLEEGMMAETGALVRYGRAPEIAAAVAFLISAERLSGLFQPYHRIQEARRHRESLGLGLYVTKG
ncbi:MAG TPA: SDR family oxidoreductase, partial [Chloroflexota bacterium]|nr:SDR family oxidoreductase [Chloroflexota bacterium]